MPLALLLGLGLLFSAASPSFAGESGLWSLQLSHDRAGSAVAMTYRVRWDLADFGRRPGRRDGRPGDSLLGAFDGRALLRRTRVRINGVRLEPFRYLLADRAQSPGGPAVAPPASLEASAARGLDLLKGDAKRELKRWLITSAFNLAVPAAGSASFAQKEAVASELLAAGRGWASAAGRF